MLFRSICIALGVFEQGWNVRQAQRDAYAGERSGLRHWIVRDLQDNTSAEVFRLFRSLPTNWETAPSRSRLRSEPRPGHPLGRERFSLHSGAFVNGVLTCRWLGEPGLPLIQDGGGGRGADARAAGLINLQYLVEGADEIGRASCRERV